MAFGTLRWWGCQPHAPAVFTPQEMFLVLIFTRGWVDHRAMVRSEGVSLKNPVTPPGIDPVTARLVAQSLNHYATPGPVLYKYIDLVLISTRSWVDHRAMVRSEGMSLKNPMTPPGIDPVTVRLVAQRLNHYATPGPVLNIYIDIRVRSINIS